MRWSAILEVSDRLRNRNLLRRRHRNLITFLTEHAHAAIVRFSDVLEIRNRRENNNFGVAVKTVEKTSARIKRISNGKISLLFLA